MLAPTSSRRTPRRATAAALAAAMAGAWWLLLADEPQRDARPGGSTAPVAPVGAANASARPGAPGRAAGDEPAGGDPSREVAPDPEDRANDNARFRLRIVDADGRPLPGAEYFTGPLPEGSANGLLESEAWRERWHPDAWLTQRCTRTVADADGFVRTMVTDVGWLYVARHEGRLAFWGWPFPDELQVLPEPSCVVRVVDTTGAPVPDAAVVLRDDDEPGTSKTPILGLTDANGECRVRHLQRLQGPRVRDDVHRLGVRGLGLRSADVRIDPERIPERVTITVPPCAPLAVELVDPLGRRYASAWPSLLLAADGEELQEFVRTTESVEFGHCAVGAVLRAATPRGVRLLGPPAARAHHLLRVPLAALEPEGLVFTGVARRADGTPLAGVTLAAGELERLGMADATTAADGRFALAVGGPQSTQLSDRLWIVQIEAERGRQGTERRSASLPIPALREPGVLDLGDVHLADAVLAVRGRVRGPAGSVPGTRVESHWFSRGVDVRCADDGAFEVWALRERRTVSLEFSAPGHVDDGRRIELPAAELDVVLQPEGACRIDVTVDEHVVPHHGSMYAELVDGHGERQRAHGSVRENVLQYEFRVLPGAYRCEVRSPFQAAPLATLEPVVARAGGDAPVAAIDLRGKLHAGRLDCVDERGGEALMAFAFAYSPAARRTVGERVVVETGDVVAPWLDVVASGPITLVVESAERFGTFEGLPANGSVRMSPWPQTTVHVLGLPPAPPRARWRLEATAESGDAAMQLRAAHGTRQRHLASVQGELGADGNVRLRLLASSRYRLQLDLVAEGASGDAIETTVATTMLDVPSPLPAVLTLQLDAAALRAAVR
jgi:hypothetical protein